MGKTIEEIAADIRNDSEVMETAAQLASEIGSFREQASVLGLAYTIPLLLAALREADRQANTPAYEALSQDFASMASEVVERLDSELGRRLVSSLARFAEDFSFVANAEAIERFLPIRIILEPLQVPEDKRMELWRDIDGRKGEVIEALRTGRIDLYHTLATPEELRVTDAPDWHLLSPFNWRNPFTRAASPVAEGLKVAGVAMLLAEPITGSSLLAGYVLLHIVEGSAA